MVKILKYIKFILCITLIVSLMVPSYAALNSTDGSIFVTKAEFDTALANFNEQLTNFESGMNSKIDSQVTSYLDRNGIWSGRDVTWEIDPNGKNLTIDDFGRGLKPKEESTKKVCRFYAKNKKSGLLYTKFSMKCAYTGANPGNWRPYMREAGAGWDGMNACYLLSLVAGECERESGVVANEQQEYSQILSTSYQAVADANAQTQSATILLFPNDHSWAIIYFVDGKRDVWLGLDLLRVNANNAAQADTSWGAWYSNGYLKVFINESFVY